MKQYISPDVTLLLLGQQDICRTSDWVGGNDTPYKSEDYGFGGIWL